MWLNGYKLGIGYFDRRRGEAENKSGVRGYILSGK
jgi:hypothetical protein